MDSHLTSDSKGKPCSEELAEFGEQVYVMDPISRHAKFDGRWIGPGTWIGKADRGDQHMTVSPGGRAAELYRSTRRIPLSQRWKAEVMTRIKVTPWQPKITEPGEIKPSRRYITWAMLQQFGSGAHSEAVVSGSRRSGIRKRRENCASWQMRRGAPLEKLVRLRPVPALQHAHLQ